jgi:DNA (cytosine-5)-methyltransferase 1
MTADADVLERPVGSPGTSESSPAPDEPVRASVDRKVRFAEFFAGIGLVRTALEPLGFEARWANDIEKMKRGQYVLNHGKEGFLLGDVRDVHADQLPRGLELATSSFPCIDVSLAGKRHGLAGKHSGLFWEFARIVGELGADYSPHVILIENVSGFANSHGGNDLREALTKLNELGYSCDLFTIDARHFVPQSRPRMFIVGIRGEMLWDAYRGIPPISDVRPDWIRNAYERNRDLILHFKPLPSLPEGPTDLSGVIDDIGEDDHRWWDSARRDAFVQSLSPVQTHRLKEMKRQPQTVWRTAYRRTRNGKATWEIRRDGIAGCLRTTGGGSSKQALVAAGGDKVRMRWMTAREYSRLMGAGHYLLHGSTDNQAQFGFGDAVVVDVVRWIGQNYLLSVLRP